ncbi:MAG TPA: hypothetical protein VGL47_01805 [Amycolatopsis sp.]|uniref:hypothetical protein n=1 Tax=Amycolatopsis sp. TaxID=37632 RepID=UPI002F3F2C52
MNEQVLIDEFTAAVRGGPPLGFDPDEVVTRVARRRRHRRNVLLAGAGVVVAALAAVAVPVTRGGSDTSVAPAAPPRTSPSTGERLWPPAGVEAVQPTDAQLSARAPEIAGRVEAMLRKVAPRTDGFRRTDQRSGRFAGVLPTSQRGVQIMEDGGGYVVSVAVYVPAAPVMRFQPRQLCAELKQQVNPATTCRYADVGTGGVLMTTEEDTVDRANTKQHRVTVTDFRADGTYVLATVSGSTGVGATPPLTADQLTSLATDPGLTV